MKIILFVSDNRYLRNNKVFLTEYVVNEKSAKKTCDTAF